MNSKTVHIQRGGAACPKSILTMLADCMSHVLGDVRVLLQEGRDCRARHLH
jgi:hypothetical protein